MRENSIRSIWQRGGAVVNGWLSIPSSFSAEVMAHQGWDSLTVDLQHGLIDYQAAVPMFQAISTTTTVPLARAPWNEPGIIMKLLDAGSYGIICPMINSRAEAEAFVGACRYTPQGYRSFGPTRAMLYAGSDYAQRANETIITMAMIETREAVNQIDEILSVPGLDGLYIGPSDLSISLGYSPVADVTEPAVLEVIEVILAAAKRHNVVAGFHAGSAEYAATLIARGFQFLTVGSDSRLMSLAATAVTSTLKAHAGERPTSAGPY